MPASCEHITLSLTIAMKVLNWQILLDATTFELNQTCWRLSMHARVRKLDGTYQLLFLRASSTLQIRLGMSNLIIVQGTQTLVHELAKHSITFMATCNWVDEPPNFVLPYLVDDVTIL